LAQRILVSPGPRRDYGEIIRCTGVATNPRHRAAVAPNRPSQTPGVRQVIARRMDAPPLALSARWVLQFARSLRQRHRGAKLALTGAWISRSKDYSFGSITRPVNRIALVLRSRMTNRKGWSASKTFGSTGSVMATHLTMATA